MDEVGVEASGGICDSEDGGAGGEGGEGVDGAGGFGNGGLGDGFGVGCGEGGVWFEDGDVLFDEGVGEDWEGEWAWRWDLEGCF